MGRKTIVYYGPNQADLKKTVKAIKSFESSRMRKEYSRILNILFGNLEDSPNFFDTLQLLIRVRKVVIALLETDYVLPKDDNALWQACMWVLLTIHCSLQKNTILDGSMNSEDELDEYYAGCSFGEFWATTYSMYLQNKISAVNAMMLAYTRGTIMGEDKDGDFVKLVIMPEKFKDEALNKSVSDLEEREGCALGKLVLADGTLCLFGLISQLKEISEEFSLKLIPSIPFHSQYLYKSAVSFMSTSITGYNNRNLSKLRLAQNVLTDKTTEFIPEILAQQFYMHLDERHLLKVIQEKLAAKGIDNYTLVRL